MREAKRRPSDDGEATGEVKRMRAEGASYLERLLDEQKKLEPFAATLKLTAILLQREIELLGGDEVATAASSSAPHMAMGLANFVPCSSVPGVHVTEESDEMMPSGHCKASIRITIPVEKYPDFNFMGRLLGPRGMTLREMQANSGCRLQIKGKGSMKPKAGQTQADLLIRNPHLTEPMHVFAEYIGPVYGKNDALSNAQSMVLPLLVPPSEDAPDAIRQKQMRELALLKGAASHHDPQHRLAPPFMSTSSTAPYLPHGPPGFTSFPAAGTQHAPYHPSPQHTNMGALSNGLLYDAYDPHQPTTSYPFQTPPASGGYYNQPASSGGYAQRPYGQ